jgi:hypothetical protein
VLALFSFHAGTVLSPCSFHAALEPLSFIFVLCSHPTLFMLLL